MSYTVLARRYRSASFDAVIGQEHIAQTLKKAIESGRIAHAYLFCGTRGTGKTSTARILAKALNCQNSDGPTTHPCNQCNSCLAIARGEDMDVVEVDAASNTGVDDVRDIIDNSQYTPAHSRFKIYIIDEVHMLSKNAFNALLKTLEEPPAHVKFILATTEPEKVLPTILSRCQRYDFRNIPTRQIAEHLKDICQKEKIDADEDALLLIAKAGSGSMRDALSLLDRLLSLGEKRLSTDMIEKLLGLPKSQLILNLAQSIGQSDVKSTLTQADVLVQSGLSTDTLLLSLVEHLRNLLILRTCGADSNLVEVPGLVLKDLVQQSQLFDPVALTQDIALLEELRRQMRLLQGGRALLDATLVRLTLADQFNSIADLLSGNVAAPAQKKKFDVTVPPVPSLAEDYSETSDSPDEDTPSADPDTPSDDLPAVGKVWEGERRSLSSMFAARRNATVPPVSSPAESAQPDQPSPDGSAHLDPANLPALWQALLARIADQGASLHGILTQARLATITDGQAVIRIAPQHETFLPRLQSNGKKDLLRDILSQLLHHPTGIRFELDDACPPEPAQSPAAASSAPARSTPQHAPVPQSAPASPAEPAQIPLTPELRQELEADPLIQAVIRELGAQLLSVRAE
jgi:DNA polymerase-3 subunit gamma/tau